MTNESAILGLIADLYNDRASLIAQRDALKARIAELEQVLTEAAGAQPDA